MKVIAQLGSLIVSGLTVLFALAIVSMFLLALYATLETLLT